MHIKNSNIGGAGGIIRDSNGNWIDELSSHIVASSYTRGNNCISQKFGTDIHKKSYTDNSGNGLQVLISLLNNKFDNKANVSFLHDYRFLLDAMG